MSTRSELISATRERYRQESRSARGLILDEFVALTGYHRKHAIRLFSASPSSARMPMERHSRPRTYGTDVAAALVLLWNLSDRLCSKRLREMMPLLLPAAVQHGVLEDRPALHALLRAISASTIDRLLAEPRIAAQPGRRRRAGMSSAVRREVPVRTFNDWNDPLPGFVEVDFVAHGGTSVAGSFNQTLVLTDIATGWTECIPVVTRSAAMVIAAIRSAMLLFPFALRGLDFDNDSAFMNAEVVPWCQSAGLIVTRSRAYKKNDQAWVEQKNGAIVRRLVGYGRLEGLGALAQLNRLYAAARLQVNLCHPSFKLVSKKRVGARVRKTWDRPRTPAQRLLDRTDIDPEVRNEIMRLQALADPVALIQEIRAAQRLLGQRVDRRQKASPPPLPMTSAPPDPREIAKASSPARLFRRAYNRKVPIPKRAKRLDRFEADIRVWLSLDPALSALQVEERISAQHGALVSQRTVQRLVKKLRAELVEAEMAAAAETATNPDRPCCRSRPPPDSWGSRRPAPAAGPEGPPG